MEIFQYLIIVFFLFATSGVFLQFRRNKMNVPSFLFWECLWVVLLLFGLFPSLFEFLSVLGVGRIVDVIVYASLVLLFYLLYRIYIKVETLQQDITKLTRIIAIKNVVKKNENVSKKSKK